MTDIALGDQGMKIPYRLVRSNRRTLSLTIESGGALVARAPLSMPISQIEAFIEQKRGWIERKRSEAAQQRAPFVPRDGACLPWLGGELRLKFCGVPLCVDFDGWLLVPRGGDARALLRDWRKRRAGEVLTPRVHLWENRMGLNVRSITYTAAKRRWGSMRADGCLRLNAALMHCPMALCDYVIVHELAHLTHPDHSPAFHALVRATLPCADELRARMRAFAGVTTLLAAPKEDDA